MSDRAIPAPDKLLRLYQELAAAPSREDACPIFESAGELQLSKSEVDALFAYYVDVTHELSE
jgi:hypothetical protein